MSETGEQVLFVMLSLAFGASTRDKMASIEDPSQPQLAGPVTV